MTGPTERIGLETALEQLPGWSQAPGEREAIARSFRFVDFNTAWGWMCRVALLAETTDHHPEWFNVYNRVDVLLTTHDANGVTERDLRMARFMDAAAQGSVA